MQMMHGMIIPCSISIILLIQCTTAFIFSPRGKLWQGMGLHPSKQKRPTSNDLMSLFYKDKDENDNLEIIFKALDTRTSIQHFLTQRSVQSFMLLLKECRDPHTCRWIEKISKSKDLLSFHGTGAFMNSNRFPEWDSLLREMMEQPADVITLRIKKPNHSLSKDNPYGEKESSVINFDIDIDPVSLAGRILSVREHIASEWAEDLDLVRSINDEIIPSYHRNVAKSRVQQIADSQLEEEDALASEDSTYNNNNNDVSDDHIFKRAEIYVLNNNPNMSDGGSSPLRASSFDLLSLLSTQASVHRVLKTYMNAGQSKKVTFDWCREYYTANVEKYFDGIQRYGRADDFLQDLLLTPSSSVVSKDGTIHFIDPVAIVKDIVKEREKVAIEWKEKMSLVSKDHTLLRKKLFVLQMAKWGQIVEDETCMEKETVNEGFQ